MVVEPCLPPPHGRDSAQRTCLQPRQRLHSLCGLSRGTVTSVRRRAAAKRSSWRASGAWAPLCLRPCPARCRSGGELPARPGSAILSMCNVFFLSPPTLSESILQRGARWSSSPNRASGDGGVAAGSQKGASTWKMHFRNLSIGA